MDLLKFIPEEQRGDVWAVLESDHLTKEEKFQFLLDTVKDPCALMKCAKFLEDQDSKPSTENFLSLIGEESRRNVIRQMIENDHLRVVDVLMNREQEHIKLAYEKWKNQSDKEKQGSTRHATAIPPMTRTTSSYTKPPSIQEPYKKENSYLTRNVNYAKPPENRSPSESSSSEESADDSDDSENQHSPPNIDTGFFDKLPDCLNILVLGETGVGKSTFINGMVNYLKYGSIEEALRNGAEILIKAYFTHTDANYNRMRIECEPTIKVERDGEAENENTEDGQSSTQSPKSYVFSWGPQGSKKHIRIIDTPGVGDVRGLNQDKVNFSKILSFISGFSDIHAICVLLKPNESRLNITMRYCINELLTHLHASASKNILFCFTNAHATFYRPGETLPSLDAHMKELNKQRKIHIPLNGDTLFCFDNDSFRYLCALREGAEFEKEDTKNYNISWVKAVQETFRLFKRISELPIHNVGDTLSINNIRAVILALSRPLAEIARQQLLNAAMIEDKVKEIDGYMKNGADLEGKLHVDQVTISKVDIPYPMTVCTAKCCVEYKRFNPNPESPMETVFKTECHNHCYLQNVTPAICPNPDLQHCAAFQNGPDNCINCNCPWSTHMHIRYKLETKMEQTADPTIDQCIKDRDGQVAAAKQFIDDQTQKKSELQADADKITKYCAEFAAFLRQHSIMPYNDVYKEYVEHLIKEEKEKVAQGGSPKHLKQMEDYRDTYEQQTKVLENHGKTTKCTKTIEEMYRMVDDLKNMKNCGNLIDEIQQVEILSVKKGHTVQVTPVDLNTGWLGKIAGGVNSLTKGVKGMFSKTSQKEKPKKKKSWK